MTVRKAAVGMTWHCESQRLEGIVLLARDSGQEDGHCPSQILTRAAVTAGRDRQDATRWQAGCASCKPRECHKMQMTLTVRSAAAHALKDGAVQNILAGP